MFSEEIKILITLLQNVSHSRVGGGGDGGVGVGGVGDGGCGCGGCGCGFVCVGDVGGIGVGDGGGNGVGGRDCCGDGWWLLWGW